MKRPLSGCRPIQPAKARAIPGCSTRAPSCQNRPCASSTMLLSRLWPAGAGNRKKSGWSPGFAGGISPVVAGDGLKFDRRGPRAELRRLDLHLKVLAVPGDAVELEWDR